MPDLVDLVMEATEWEGWGLDALAERAAATTLTHLALEPDDFEVALLACDDTRIAKLNTAFRSKPTPTNVLSWPAQELGAQLAGAAPSVPESDGFGEPTELGDIAIAFQTCKREANEAQIAFEDHITHLIVHGTLHLLGYDHTREADGDLMEGIETAILAKLGISDPYSEPR